MYKRNSSRRFSVTGSLHTAECSQGPATSCRRQDPLSRPSAVPPRGGTTLRLSLWRWTLVVPAFGCSEQSCCEHSCAVSVWTYVSFPWGMEWPGHVADSVYRCEGSPGRLPERPRRAFRPARGACELRSPVRTGTRQRPFCPSHRACEEWGLCVCLISLVTGAEHLFSCCL